MSWPPYLASDDSALLRRAMGGRSGERILEIGAGNGGNLVEVSRRFRTVVGTDLVRPSMTDWKGAGVNFILADGASCVRGEAFDVVAFNPPYLHEDVEDAAVDGGRALEVPKKMLKDALRVAKREGEVLFVLNDRAERGEFEGICLEAGFALGTVASEKLFFEALTVYSAKVA